MPKEAPKTLIEHLISERGLNDREVAHEIGFRDVFDWSRFLRGEVPPNKRQLAKLTEILGVPTRDLVLSDGYPRPYHPPAVRKPLGGMRPWSALEVTRLAVGRTREDMGALIGVSAEEWKRLERRKGPHPTTPEQRRTIADALGTQTWKLWSRDGQLERPEDEPVVVTLPSNFACEVAVMYKDPGGVAR